VELDDYSIRPGLWLGTVNQNQIFKAKLLEFVSFHIFPQWNMGFRRKA